tara:strand:+ start:537 stop:950 length:414 start_codon:yes stop_codon:yes gene_type:complete
MNQLHVLLLISLLSVQAFSQNSSIPLNYYSELPFSTSNDSKYYHLESSVLIRSISNDMISIITKDQDETKDFHFSITFKSNNGAELLINYLVPVKKIKSILNVASYIEVFKKESYDWINGSFRSNLPYKDYQSNQMM